MIRPTTGTVGRLVMWLTLALLAVSGAVLVHLMARFYPQGYAPEFGPPGPRPPSTAQVIEWLRDGVLTLGAVAIWVAVAVRLRGRWPAGVALGVAVWFVVVVANVYLHYDAPAGGVRWHFPPWWFWFAWRWSVRGSWVLALLLVIRSRLRARAGVAPDAAPGAAADRGRTFASRSSCSPSGPGC